MILDKMPRDTSYQFLFLSWNVFMKFMFISSKTFTCNITTSYEETTLKIHEDSITQV